MTVLGAHGTKTSTKIAVEGLCYDYVDQQSGTVFRALEELNLDVQRDEFLTIVGPSGCGKSTLLFTIAGLKKPTRGSISIDGSPITGPGADRGVVFQDYALLPWKTASENISLGLKLRNVKKVERRQVAEEYLALFNLAGFGDKYPHELSGGMRQRVAVARTLANSPSVVLMDEPFGAVDAQTREQLGAELVQISARRAMTVVFITHSVEEAVLLGDRVVIMSARPGRVSKVLPVEISREERSWEVMRENALFRELVVDVSAALRSAIHESNVQ